MLEIRPTINWDKGKALEFLLESLGKLMRSPSLCVLHHILFNNAVCFQLQASHSDDLFSSLGFADCKNVMPIYIGDDRTDEDAFKVDTSATGRSACLSLSLLSSVAGV